ncbi:MAG: hypothetical protein ACI38A_04120 [Candidatus Ornithomonoglobus sp.]
MTTDEKLDLILGELGGVKSDINQMKDKIESMEGKIGTLEGKIGTLEAKMNAFETDMNEFREEVHEYKAVAEETVDKTIKILGEAVKINADRYDRMDFDGMKRNTEIAVAMTQMLNDRLNFLERAFARK